MLYKFTTVVQSPLGLRASSEIYKFTTVVQSPLGFTASSEICLLLVGKHSLTTN